jgi:Cellulase (glycosyl hydrolase family 5)
VLAGHRRHLLTLLLAIGLAGGLAAVGVGLLDTFGAGLGTSQAAAEGNDPAPSGTGKQTGTGKPLADACHHARGPFHVDKTAVYGSTGRYIPYGISLTGLAHPNYAPRVAQDESGILAAADDWCANTIRLQIRQANLVSATGHIHKPFLDAVIKEVRFAEKQGLVVVLNLQWQLDPHRLYASMPTRRSKAFWSSLASHFGTDPDVIFDIFNEPAQRAPCGWAFWHYGGWCRGVRYFGMQELADYVRARAKNLFWIEGISAGSLLNQAWLYHITGDGPLEYSEHRPPGKHDYRAWDHIFGYISTSGHAPVVEGEWADYARPAAPWACWANAPESAPRFLNYLRVRKFGLIITQLVKDQLLESENLDDPTHFRSNWSCTRNLDQGVGHQAQQWFIRQNGGS